jgi:hypothetical protein
MKSVFGLQHTEPIKKLISNLVEWERSLKWHLCPSSFLSLPALRVFVLCSDGASKGPAAGIWRLGLRLCMHCNKALANHEQGLDSDWIDYWPVSAH